MELDRRGHSTAEDMYTLVPQFNINAFKSGKARALEAYRILLDDGVAIVLQGAHALMDGATFYRIAGDWGKLTAGIPVEEITVQPSEAFAVTGGDCFQVTCLICFCYICMTSDMKCRKIMKKISAIIAAVAALALASCTKEQVPVKSETEIKLDITVADMYDAATKAAR